MLWYILRRVLLLLPTLFLVSIISFSLIYITPGDPAEILLTGPGGGADPKAVEEFRVRMGLDQPFYIQYLRWLNDVLHGDFGYSYMTDQPVADTVFDSFLSTLKLAAVSMVIALLIAIPFGILAAMKHNTIIDDLSRLTALIGVSIPNFWQGFLLILIFSLYLGWFPVAGYGDGGDLKHIILPAVTLGTSSAAVTMRLMRSSMFEALEQDYIITARAKGLHERVVIGKHALKNALIPVVTMIGLNAGFLLNGSPIIEVIFAWPGIGRLVVSSIYQRDYPMIQGSILFVEIIFLTVNFIFDILYTYINPRIRYEAGD